MKAAVICLIFALAIIIKDTGASWFEKKPKSCSDFVDDYQRRHGNHVKPTDLSNALIFFLHVPRTAGKTYATCLLRAILPPSKRCSPSYDELKYHLSQEGCRLIVSHDDYSAVDQLPKNTVLITQLRNPLSRILSSYEFTVEVAGRGIKTNDTAWEAGVEETHFTNTLQVWPWNYLIRSLRGELKKKLQTLELAALIPGNEPLWREYFDNKTNKKYYHNFKTKTSVWKLPPAEATLDPYDNPLTMPLKDWIETPEAFELLHEGTTLQLLGLTNYSRWNYAKELRQCLFNDPQSKKRLVQIAKERLTSMLHVGITEDLDRSIESLAAVVGADMDGRAWKYTSKKYYSYDPPDADIDNTWRSYNATRENPAGEIVELTIREARLVAIALDSQIDIMGKNLTKLEPQLKELVEMEHAWLEEEEKKAGKHVEDDGPIPRTKNLKSIVHDENYPFDEDFEIQSPWADEIMALDKKVYEIQQRREKFTIDAKKVKSIEGFKGPKKPKHRAKLMVRDEDFIEPEPLGKTYRSCCETVAKESNKKRLESFGEFKTPQHETFAFSSSTRKAIDPKIMQRIVQLNEADMELWEFGKNMLSHMVSHLQTRGHYKRLPPETSHPAVDAKKDKFGKDMLKFRVPSGAHEEL